MKTAYLALVAGSTCRGQSGGGDGVAKEGETPAQPAIVEVPGVDTSTLTPRERREFSTYVTEFLAPCPDVPVSLAQCVREKRACGKCAPAAKLVAKSVRDGMSREQVEAAYKNRFAPDRVKNVPVDGSPVKGAEDAPVTVVEFADFECSACGRANPAVEKVLETQKGNVRFVFKHYPLPIHPHGEAASRAAFAAGQQGKFWEMHKKLFDNQRHLEAMDLEGYAKDLGLDLAKFRADAKGQAATDRIDRDKKLGDSLGLKGTPTFYINGREFNFRSDLVGELNEWIEAEVGGAKAAEAAK